MTKTNKYYFYLVGRIDKVAGFQDGMSKEERANDKIRFNVLFMTIDRIAAEISKGNTEYPKDLYNACICLTYTDIYTLTEMIINHPEIINYEY